MVRTIKRPGNNEIRGPNYNGQFNAPSHMLTLADVKALQEDTQVGGKIKLGKFTRDFGKGFVTGFTGVMNSPVGKAVVGHTLNRMTGSGYDYNPYMADEVHLEGGGFGSFMKKAASNKMVKGLTKAALKEATPFVSNAIANRTGMDPTLTKQLTKAVVNKVNNDVIGAGFGSFMKKAVNNKLVKDLAKAGLKQATPMMSNAIAARTGLDPALTKQLTKAAVNKVNNDVIGAGLVGIYDKGPTKRTRRKAGPNDKRARRGAIVSQLMREHKMSLAEASRYIRDNGIEY